MVTWFSGQNGNGTPAATAGNKMQGYGNYGWIRIDLGIDGQTKKRHQVWRLHADP